MYLMHFPANQVHLQWVHHKANDSSSPDPWYPANPAQSSLLLCLPCQGVLYGFLPAGIFGAFCSFAYVQYRRRPLQKFRAAFAEASSTKDAYNLKGVYRFKDAFEVIIENDVCCQIDAAWHDISGDQFNKLRSVATRVLWLMQTWHVSAGLMLHPDKHIDK